MVCDRAVIAEQAARSASVDERRCSWHRFGGQAQGRRDQEVSAREPSLGASRLHDVDRTASPQWNATAPRASRFDVTKTLIRRA